jgi:hypothetical protein
MEIGTKIQMDNGMLGIQQGVVIDYTWCPIIRWDTPEEFDDEELGDNFEQFDGIILPDDWKFTYINDDGTLKNKNEKMNNLKTFEEYMYRKSGETDKKSKMQRAAKSKEWFILKLVGMGKSRKELENLSVADLGRLYAKKTSK